MFLCLDGSVLNVETSFVGKICLDTCVLMSTINSITMYSNVYNVFSAAA